MSIARLFMLGITTATAVAFAQDPFNYDGKWSATYSGQSGASREAELIIKGLGGTWKLFPIGGEAKKNNCVGREFPITVESSSPNELKFSVDASKIIQGCSDSNVTATPIDAKNMEGHFGGGRSIRFVRQ
jgi:hypothetical protein